MHIFLQGQRNIGKSTVIKKTLEVLSERKQLVLGGFFTWNGGNSDPYIYMKPAGQNGKNEVFRIACFGKEKGGMVCDTDVFESDGVRLVLDGKCADLIIMDELGYLESGAPGFRQAVLDALVGTIPILGVLRLGTVPWHNEIKRNRSVTLYDVNEDNRNELPRKLADEILPLLSR